MKRIMLAAMIVAMMMFSAVAFSFDIPAPTGYVNDFAEIIPSESKSQLEKKIQDYEKHTTIEIAVVTVASLDGMDIEQWTIELVEKPGWGVGKKGKDNGIVIVVAPNERKYRIEVGNGLQGDLPDSAAGSLGREHLVEAFRAGDYAGGIENLVGGIMKTLGNYTEEERIKVREQKAQEALAEAERQMQREKEIKAFLGTAAMVVAIVAVVAGIIFGIFLAFRKISRVIKEAKRKKTLREAVGNSIKAHREKADFLSGKLKAVKEVGSNFPEWASKDLREYVTSANRKIESAKKECASTSEMVENNPDGAKEALRGIQQSLKEAEEYIQSAERIPSLIKAYKEDADSAIKEAEEDLSEIKEDVKNVAAEGFWVGTVLEGLEEKGKALSNLRDEWSINSEEKRYLSGRDFMVNAKAVKDAILKASNKLELIRETKKSVDANLAEFPAKIGTVKKSIKEHQIVLEKIKKIYPEENWKDIEAGFLAIPQALVEAERLFVSAGEKNSFSSQKFFEAESEIASAVSLVDSSKKSLEKINQRQVEIDKAKSFFANNQGAVAASVEKAAKKVRESDVSSKAKRISQEAKEKLESVRAYSGNGNVVNWILAAATLGTIAELAASAVRVANSDISTAEAVRAEAARAKKRKDEESSRSSYSSSYSSNNSSDSSGFGGGGFSGGGASGGW